MTAITHGLLWHFSCAGPPANVAPEVAGRVAEEWPDTGLPWSRGITLVHDGVALASGASVQMETAPAGIEEISSLHFVLTNRRQETLALADDGEEWLDAGAFSWNAPPPVELGPGESAAFSLEISPLDYTEEAWPERVLRIPMEASDFSVALEAHVPAPLRIVVGGDGGYTLVSDSYGADFYEALPASSARPLNALVWGEGVFVRSLSEDSAAFEYSGDGIQWEEARSEPASPVAGCAYGLGRFVCVRSDTITWSDDGRDFVHGETFHDYELNAVVFAGDRFIAAGEGGRKTYSLDGLIWNGESFSGSPDAYYGIAGDTETMVAVGGMNRYFVSASLDGGENWTSVPFGNCPMDRMASVAYSGGIFLAQGESDCHHNLHSSADGIIWGPVFGVEPFERYELLGAANGHFIAQKRLGEQAALYRSVDGSNWEEAFVLPPGKFARKMAVEAWP
jgi:hypothetical protein